MALGADLVRMSAQASSSCCTIIQWQGWSSAAWPAGMPYFCPPRNAVSPALERDHRLCACGAGGARQCCVASRCRAHDHAARRRGLHGVPWNRKGLWGDPGLCGKPHDCGRSWPAHCVQRFKPVLCTGALSMPIHLSTVWTYISAALGNVRRPAPWLPRPVPMQTLNPYRSSMHPPALIL